MLPLDQKERELAHFHVFRESTNDFPKGKIISGETPDFLVKSETATVGIELTELFHEPRKDGTILQARETYSFQILNRAHEIYRNKASEPISVYVIFSIHAKLRKSKVNKLAEMIVEIALTNVPNTVYESNIFQRSYKDKILPAEISMLKVTRINTNDSPQWYPTGIGGAIPNVPSKFVKERIDEKNLKIKSYRKKCDEAWLLIVVDGFLPSTWFDVKGESLTDVFESEFDKIYLLDFQNRKSYLLKTK